MKILDDLISGLNFDVSVRDIRLGVFHTGVLTRHCGLAATMSGDALQKEPMRVKNSGFLLDKPPEELARMAYSKSLLDFHTLCQIIHDKIQLYNKGKRA